MINQARRHKPPCFIHNPLFSLYFPSSQQTFNHSPMKKLILASFVFSFVMLSGCQMLFGTSDDQSTSEPAVQTVQNDILPQKTDLKDVEPQPTGVQVPSQEIPKEETVPNLPKPPSEEHPTTESDDTVDTPDAPVPPAPDNALNEPQFNNPDELKQYIADNQETLKKNELPPKNIKCHVHTENLNSKFFEHTNEYETKFSENGLKASYCNEKTIQYYGSGEFDFECYEVKKDNETKVKNGFEVNIHLSCASNNIPGPDGAAEIKIVNPFYDPNSKNINSDEADAPNANEGH